MSILVGYVATPAGEAAAQTAIAEAALRGERLIIVNSAREGALVDTTVASPEDLARVRASAEGEGVETEVLRPAHGDDLAEEILELARAHDATLIVIGLRRRSQVGKFILGSQAQRILLQADRPVLAVKAAQED